MAFLASPWLSPRKPVVLGFGHCASLQQEGWEIGVSRVLEFSHFFSGMFLGFSSSFLAGPTWNFWVIWDIFNRGTFQTALWGFPVQLIIQPLDITQIFIRMKRSSFTILRFERNSCSPPLKHFHLKISCPFENIKITIYISKVSMLKFKSKLKF